MMIVADLTQPFVHGLSILLRDDEHSARLACASGCPDFESWFCSSVHWFDSVIPGTASPNQPHRIGANGLIPIYRDP